MSYSALRRPRTVALVLALGLAAPLSAQLAWSVSNETTVTPAPAATSTNGVTVTVPAGQRVTLVATNFTPVDFTNVTSGEVYVTTTFKVSGGLSSISSGTRAIGYGLYNNNGTATDFSDDNGYFTWLNGRQTGALIELRRRNSAGASPSLLNPTGASFNSLGTGTTTQTAGVLSDSSTYAIQLHLIRASGGISLGNTSSTTSGAGIWVSGDGVSQTAYTNPDAPAATTVFNEIGFMFLNTSANAVTLEIVSVTGLTPSNPPAIAMPPAALILNPGQSAALSVGATGTAPLAYQWKKDGANLPGATAATLPLASAATTDAGSYTVTVTNTYGNVTSAAATVTVTTTTVPATITAQPTAVTVNAGERAIFAVAAFGSAPVTYQWQKNGAAIASATASALSFFAALPGDAGPYSVVVANGAGSVTSSTAVLTVNTVPSITTQPVSATVGAGQSVTFTVAASGNPAPAYQWLKNGTPITGATAATLNFTSAQLADTGVYSVRAINSVDSATSGPAVLAIPSAMVTTALFPASGRTGLNIDTPLSITFDRPPVVGNSGRIRIFKASDNSVVDTIDLGAAIQLRSVGTNPTQLNYFPVIVTGNTAAIYPHAGVLAYGQTYYVTVELGALRDTTNASFTGISDSAAWRFTTKSAGPATNVTAITVAADGTGDFTTVQGAIDFVPANNAQRVVITVKKGTYLEQIYLGSTKPLVTVRGEDRVQSVITYPNNNNLNGSTRTRGVFTIAANDFTLETLTVFNSTPQGGSQAESFVCDGLRVLINRVNLRSRQDTLLCNTGTTFITDSYIEGNTDFIWGTAAAYFQRCELKALDTAGGEGFYTQVRNSQNQIGFVFVDCQLTGEPTASRYYLGRIDPNPGNFPYSQAVYINCGMGPHLFPVGWQLNNATTSTTVQDWEYQSTDLNGALLDVSRRLSSSKQIDAATAEQYRSPAFVLGGWNPALAPTIEVSPASRSATPGSLVRLSVVANGAPQPTYQWFKDGVPVTSPGAQPDGLPQLAWSVFDETTSRPLSPAADGKVTVTIPAGQRVTLTTTNFVPFDLTAAAPGTIADVSLTFTASGGLSNLVAGTRAIGVGLFNNNGTSPGTSFADDGGYFTWINGRSAGGSTVELRRRNGDGTSPSLLNATGTAFASLGTGVGDQTGALSDGVPYTFTLRLVRSATGVSLGTNSGTGVAGVWLRGTGFSQSAYTNPDVPPAATAFNQLGFMFLNTSASAVTLTLDNLVGFRPVGAPAYAGATNAALVIPTVQATDAGSYTVHVTNAAGSITSAPALLTVTRGRFAGTYFGTIAGGGTFSLFVRDDGTGVFLGNSGGTGLLSRTVAVDAGGRLRFSANLSSNVDATIDSTGALTGTVSGAALNGTRSTGATAVLAGFYQAATAESAAATYVIVGAGGQAYVLVQNGTQLSAGTGTIDLTGRLTATVGVQAVTATVAAGAVAISGTAGSVVFSGANDSLVGAQRFRQISTRSGVVAGGSSTVGFVLTGDSPVDVLIRGVGPALSAFGVGNALAAPKLDLYAGGTLLTSNTRWSTALNSADIAAGAALAGAFPFGATSADSAIRARLNPGAYSAVMTSATATGAGVGLVEIYDITAGTAGQRLVNLSSLALAGAGDNTLIAGVLVSGTTPKRILVRAVGPSLAQARVNGFLARPVLSLFQGSRLMAQNASLATSADAIAITAANLEAGAFPLTAGAPDSALLVNLAPGLYTAQVTSVDNASGLALIEFYELP